VFFFFVFNTFLSFELIYFDQTWQSFF